MSYAVVKLAIAASLPVLMAALFYLLDKYSPFGKLNPSVKQIIYGICFGGLAILGTEWGIPMNGAVTNCRDAAVVIAGLMFGAPAGIIAGVIGAVERWFAVYWGIGEFTRIACSVSTLVAGVYAAALRKYMFEDKKPAWAMAFASGFVIEVFHLSMVFITNMATPVQAVAVVRACTIPMLLANSFSVLFAGVALTFLSKEKGVRLKRPDNIASAFQRWLFLTVVFVFVVSSVFVYNFEDSLTSAQAETLLESALEDVSADINDASNKNILNICREVAKEVDTAPNLNQLAEKYNISEINLVNKEGIIDRCNTGRYNGFDMKKGAQSAEFLCLLGDTKELVQEYGPISYDKNLSRKYAGVKTDDGFIQVGYDAEDFQRDIADQVVDAARNRHVGETGYVLIMDSHLDLVSAPQEFTDRYSRDKLGSISPKADTTFTMTIMDEPALCRYTSTEGYYLIAVYPEAEVTTDRNVALYVNTFLQVLSFAILFVLVYMLIKRLVVNQIKSINKSLSKISGGDFEEVVDVRTSDEFASLSDDINATVNTLKHYINEATTRIDQELEFARNIQSSALPTLFPAYPNRNEFDIFASMRPAKEVGGDFYDFYFSSKDTFNLLVADVSGKGIPAAMFMMRAKTELKSLTESLRPLDEVFFDGNNALCDGNEARMFVTAWQGSIDLETGIVRYVNAGHNPPLIRHENGEFEYFKSPAGFVLAGMPDFKYSIREVKLEPGDEVYLYTDGVTEAMNREKELYGEDRLKAALNSANYETMEQLCARVRSSVEKFAGGEPQVDDMTMLAFRYNGKTEYPTLQFERASFDDIQACSDLLESELEKHDIPMTVNIPMNVAIDELYSNIVRHAYPEDEKGPASFSVRIDETSREISLRFTDEGIPYNPLMKEDPNLNLTAEERQVGGLGIFLVKKTMDDMKYKYEDGKNILTILKKY